MKIKVSSSFGGKVSTGSFENSSPFFSAEVELTVKEGSDVLAKISELQDAIQSQCQSRFKLVAEQLSIERLEKERKEIRFYKSPSGKKLPSVTSIIPTINFDFYGIDNDELAEYSAQGNITHARIAHYIDSGKWVNPKELEIAWADIHALKTGKLGLDPDNCDFQAFLEKYPIENLKNCEAIFNEEHGYAGTPDFTGIPSFKGADPIPSVCDAKRSVDKVKNFKQMSAYAKCLGVKQMIIVPLNNTTAQGFSKPIVSADVDGYFEMFLSDLAKFKKRYGI